MIDALADLLSEPKRPGIKGTAVEIHAGLQQAYTRSWGTGFPFLADPSITIFHKLLMFHPAKADGMPRDCAVNLDHLQTVAKGKIVG